MPLPERTDQILPSLTQEVFWEEPWMGSARKDRGFEEYTESLGIDFTMFVGQRVLDLGAGLTAQFAREAAEHNIDVTSLNPGWSNEDYMKYANFARSDVYQRSTAGRAESLPFKNDAFDFIVSFWAIPIYLPGTREAYEDTFAELRRVMAPNSWGFFVPIAKGAYKIDEFHEILGKYFPESHEFLGDTFIPKLLLYKDIERDKLRQIDMLKPDMEEATFSIW
jgi:ubiquinone/menaquinone biosynthesis C-methylase UbiE